MSTDQKEKKYLAPSVLGTSSSAAGESSGQAEEQPLQCYVPCSFYQQGRSRSLSSTFTVHPHQTIRASCDTAAGSRADITAPAVVWVLTELEEQWGLSVPHPGSRCPHPSAGNLASGPGWGAQVGAASCKASVPGAPPGQLLGPLHAGHESRSSTPIRAPSPSQWQQSG